ncbi:hypothetical protein A7U60_g4147 [Sanghuangporus baumii]|uniref:DUF7770 domain-containing protein n=1 Tax=Sanghuangporus baumii TaxID=108892 RepID=A0A9Q5HZ64_SANBA|nr:hypothetical protein A7U60_g4147 [Sanghuangporus baumii]
MPVDYVAVVGTPVGSVYHFRFSLVQEATEESVRIDMVPRGRDDMIGVAKVEYNPYIFSWTYGPQPFKTRVREGMTVATILRIIFDENRMDQYTFVGSGQGCRHWCACVLDKLAENNLVHHSVPRMFIDDEAEEHARFGISYPMPRIRGTFYQ